MANRIGLGGGCHWCTEGIFQSLLGVIEVKQGWIASTGEYSEYSEAVEIYFNPQVISLSDIIQIHIHTHASQSNHLMRAKYRSAIYTISEEQTRQVIHHLDVMKDDFEKAIITKVLKFESFKPNEAKYRDYFFQSPNKPFCQTYIHPKLKFLINKYGKHINHEKLQRAGVDLA